MKAVCEHFRAPQFGHNMNLLLQAIETFVAVTESLPMACARLNRYYTFLPVSLTPLIVEHLLTNFSQPTLTKPLRMPRRC